MPDEVATSKCVFEGELKVLWELGQGSHGELLLVEDSHGQEFGVKTASAGSFAVKLLEHEYKVYQHLQCHKKKIPGLPQVFKCGFDHLHDKHVLVMSRLGASMGDVMKLNRSPIPEYAALRIGCQLIRRLQYLHDMGLVHCDVKPRNILCGHEKFEKVYLVDFGLATFYKNMRSGKHNDKMTGQRFKGTADFASRNAHKCLSLSRRDDLESLGFTLIYMIRGGLPWSKSLPFESPSWSAIVENEIEPAEVYSKSREKVDVEVMKENISIDALCAGMPDCMLTYMRYVYCLAFDQSPDYKLLIKMLEERMDQLKTMGGEDNGDELIIWTVPYERSRYMRIKRDKEIWADYALERDVERSQDNAAHPEDGRDNAQSDDNVIEKTIPDAKRNMFCNLFRYLRISRKRRFSIDEYSNEGSQVSSLLPHPVLYKRPKNWWTNLLVFLRLQKPILEPVVLHYSLEGFESETEERHW